MGSSLKPHGRQQRHIERSGRGHLPPASARPAGPAADRRAAPPRAADQARAAQRRRLHAGRLPGAGKRRAWSASRSSTATSCSCTSRSGLVFLSILMVIGMRWSQARSREEAPQQQPAQVPRLPQLAWSAQLAEDANAQLVAADRLYPDHERLWGLVLSRRHLWERRGFDPRLPRRCAWAGARCRTRARSGSSWATTRSPSARPTSRTRRATVRKRWARVTDVPVVIDLDERPRGVRGRARRTPRAAWRAASSPSWPPSAPPTTCACSPPSTPRTPPTGSG